MSLYHLSSLPEERKSTLYTKQSYYFSIKLALHRKQGDLKGRSDNSEWGMYGFRLVNTGSVLGPEIKTER